MDGIPIKLKNEALGDFRGKYQEGKMPVVNIWLSGACDLKCPYCATGAGKPDKDELGPGEWISVIRDCKELGADTLFINGKGEPLLDHGFKDIINFASSKAMMRTVMYTNGRKVSQRTARFLYQNMVDIVLKMPSMDPAVYDELAGVKNAHRKAFAGLENLLRAGYPDASEFPHNNEVLTRLGFQVLLAKPALETVPEVFRYCRERSIYPMVDDIVAAGRVLENRNLESLEISPEEEAKLYHGFLKEFGYHYGGESNTDCAIRMGMFIDNRGFVRADRRGNSCDVPYKDTVGNVRDAPAGELWKKLKDLRKEAGNELRPVEPGPETRRESFPRCYRMLEARMEYFQD